MARKGKAKALLPKMITVYGEILQETEDAILVRCDDDADGVWLAKSQIKYDGERGDIGVEIQIPDWLANEKGFFDGMGYAPPQTEAVHIGDAIGSVVDAAKPESLPEPEHICKTCMQWGGEEVGPDAGECVECSVRDPEEATGDYWLPANDAPRCETCAHHGADYPDDCEPCQNDESAPNWKPSHPCFAPVDSPVASEFPVDPEEDDTPTSLPASSLQNLGYEKIEYTRSLDENGKREFADRMSNAIRRKAELEEELAATGKSFRNRIKALEQEAAEAADAYENSFVTEIVHAAKMADYDNEEIVWLDTTNDIIIKRRPMLPSERQFPLPGLHDQPFQAVPQGETVGAPSPQEHTCLNCEYGQAASQGDDLPEPCQTCSQVDNGDTDNWAASRECRTCKNSTTDVHMPPCRGCSLNPVAAADTDEDRWEGEDPGFHKEEDSPSLDDSPSEPERRCSTCAQVHDERPDDLEDVNACTDCGPEDDYPHWTDEIHVPSGNREQPEAAL